MFQVAIANHNRLEIASNLSSEEEFYCRFLRDIDVIDIFRQQAVSEEFNYDTPVSVEVERQFLEHRLIDRSVLKEPSDSILVEIAYVFGIHFPESYELLVELDNLNLFLDSIAVDPSMEEDFHTKKEEVYRYLLHQLEVAGKNKEIEPN